MASYTVEQVGKDLWQVVDWDTRKPAQVGGTSVQPTTYEEACDLATAIQFNEADQIVAATSAISASTKVRLFSSRG